MRAAAILYAEDFDADPVTAPPPPPPPPLFTEAELAAACEAARAEGMREGARAAEGEQLALTARALAEIEAALDDAREAAVARAEAAAEEVARLLLAALGAAFPELCSAHGPAEAAAVARTILPALAREPSVSVRAAPRSAAALAAALAAELDRRDPDLAARLRVVPAPGMTEGDVRVAWTDGTATRDVRAVWRGVLDALTPAGLTPAPSDGPAEDTPTFAFEEAARAG
jgi:flagellar assembly protein FliH